MITLEQVKLLDQKVTKAVEYINKLTGENSLLKGKLDTYQKRIDDLEVLIKKFKEDQNRIEDGILSALDRLNQFEDALENTLSAKSKLSSESKLPSGNPVQAEVPPEKDQPVQEDSETSNPDNELDIF